MNIEHVTKAYGNIKAIDNVSITSYTSFLGLLGPNGSGKSTLINLMLGLIKPDTGEIDLGVAKRDIRMVPDYPVLPENLTIDQWMAILEKYYGKFPKNLDMELEFRLNGSWKIGGLSVGQKRLVSLLPIFFGTPKLIILDEPTNFLDITMREKVLSQIKEHLIRTESKVIIASHRIDEIELFASEILLLNKGRLNAKILLRVDYREGYRIRVNNTEAFESYLQQHDIDYKLEQTLLGKVYRVDTLKKVFDPLQRYNNDGGFIFHVSAVNSLQRRLKELN